MFQLFNLLFHNIHTYAHIFLVFKQEKTATITTTTSRIQNEKRKCIVCNNDIHYHSVFRARACMRASPVWSFSDVISFSLNKIASSSSSTATMEAIAHQVWSLRRVFSFSCFFMNLLFFEFYFWISLQVYLLLLFFALKWKFKHAHVCVTYGKQRNHQIKIDNLVHWTTSTHIWNIYDQANSMWTYK